MSAQPFLPTPNCPYIGPCDVLLNPPEPVPRTVLAWVAHVANLTQPEAVQWWNGTRAERDQLQPQLWRAPDATTPGAPAQPAPQGPSKTPGARAAGSRIFSCTRDRALAEPADLWAEPDSMRRTLLRLFDGCMRGRRMWVVPYAMATTSNEPTHLGIELTDSPFVVKNLTTTARTGRRALDQIRAGAHWVASVHSVGYPLVDESGTPRPDVAWPCSSEKWIAQFPESEDVGSYGTGFGAVALVG